MRKLYRSHHNRKIAGICGGLAEYFDLDPTLIRLIFVAAFIFTGFLPMLLIYLIGWIVIPKAPHT